MTRTIGPADRAPRRVAGRVTTATPGAAPRPFHPFSGTRTRARP
ncbi:hypothetical protein [Amaricoccus solimangrovi]|nr:hypothetical protein [Amaricoccus solimangrovi]